MKRGAILATNVDARRRPYRGGDLAPADVIGTHSSARPTSCACWKSCAQKVRQRRARYGHATRQAPEESGCRLGCVRRLHRQSHARAIRPPVAVPGRRRRLAAADRRRAVDVSAWQSGRFHDVRHGGHGHRYAIRQRRYVEKPHITYSRLADRVVELGRLGQKSGKGWYRYEAGNRTPLPDPEIDTMIEAYRAEMGLVRADRRRGDRSALCGDALVNEGARILAEGIALRASDIDVVYLMGYGVSGRDRRTDVPCAAGGTAKRGGDDEALRCQPARRSGLREPAPLLVTAAEAGRWPKKTRRSSARATWNSCQTPSCSRG